MHDGKDWNEAAVLSWARSGVHCVDLGSGWARSGVIWAVLGSLFERLCGSGLHLESTTSCSRPRVSVGHLTGRCREDLGFIWARPLYFVQFLLDPDSIWGGDWGWTSENMLLLFSRCHQFIHCFIWPALQSIPILIPQQSRWVRHLTASSIDVLHTQNGFLLSEVDAPLEKHEYAHTIARGLPLGNWSVA